MEFIVDVQCFKRPVNNLVHKEVAIIPLAEDSIPTVLLFQPPYEWNFVSFKYKSENEWLERNYHGLSWESGEVSYGDLEEILKTHLKNASKIHVKGLEKQKWLQQILPNVFNLEDIGCPAFKKLNVQNACYNHSSITVPKCAASNVIALGNWLIEYHNSPVGYIYKDITRGRDVTDDSATNCKEFYENCEEFF